MNTNEAKNLDSYVEADQLFYFDKSKIKYKHLGTLDTEIFNLIIEFMEELSNRGIELKQILDKAQKIELPET